MDVKIAGLYKAMGSVYMRVIAGSCKGRALKALKGDATRPTIDRVKESLFSSLISQRGSFENAEVLDAFAGTGSLGIEALSRGAKRAVFIDKARPAQVIIEQNLSLCGFDHARYCVLKTDTSSPATLARLQRNKDCFDVVLLDPPYALAPHEVLALIEAWWENGVLSPEVVVSYELDKNNYKALQEALCELQWSEVSYKTFGDCAVALLRRDR